MRLERVGTDTPLAKCLTGRRNSDEERLTVNSLRLPEPTVVTSEGIACLPGGDAVAQPDGQAVDYCPTCGRSDALLVISEVIYCVACGYASDGARGCT